MRKIIVVGYKVGFDKIGANRLLRERFGYSLGSAKKAVDDILEGREIELEIQDDALASASGELAALGAMCRSDP